MPTIRTLSKISLPANDYFRTFRNYIISFVQMFYLYIYTHEHQCIHKSLVFRMVFSTMRYAGMMGLSRQMGVSPQFTPSPLYAKGQVYFGPLMKNIQVWSWTAEHIMWWRNNSWSQYRQVPLKFCLFLSAYNLVIIVLVYSGVQNVVFMSPLQSCFGGILVCRMLHFRASSRSLKVLKGPILIGDPSVFFFYC